MKKALLSLLLIASVGMAANAFADTTVSCNDIVGTWRGTLGSLSSVSLSIYDTGGDSMSDADISFKDSDGMKAEYGMLTGQCQENADGSVTMNLSQHLYGSDVTLKTRLISPTQLDVSSFTYSDPVASGSGSGTLTKSQ